MPVRRDFLRCVAYVCDLFLIDPPRAGALYAGWPHVAAFHQPVWSDTGAFGVLSHQLVGVASIAAVVGSLLSFTGVVSSRDIGIVSTALQVRLRIAPETDRTPVSNMCTQLYWLFLVFQNEAVFKTAIAPLISLGAGDLSASTHSPIFPI